MIRTTDVATMSAACAKRRKKKKRRKQRRLATVNTRVDGRVEYGIIFYDKILLLI